MLTGGLCRQWGSLLGVLRKGSTDEQEAAEGDGGLRAFQSGLKVDKVSIFKIENRKIKNNMLKIAKH
jgi:hypothetical protein